MHTDSSKYMPTTAIYVGGAGATVEPGEAPQTAPLPEPESGPWARDRLASQPVVDWNRCPPDGSPTTLQRMLESLSATFRGDVYLGVTTQFTELEVSTSRRQDDPTARSKVRSAIMEAMQSKKACLFATAEGQSSLVLQQLRQSTQAVLVLGFGAGIVPTDTSPDAAEFGVVVCVANSGQLHSKEVLVALITQTQREFQAWLQVWRRCRAGTHFSLWKKRLKFYRGRKGRVALAVAGLLLAAMAIPLPYWPQRDCTVEPASRSFVASPIDGRIRLATVRPGDIVKQGQLLAQLDDEQLRWQLSVAQAEYESASKKRDTALATRAGGELRLAQLEQERIALQIESLQQHLGRLELRSPADGVVVQGDWFQCNGAPVSRGDMLFEIAPMDQMRVEIHLSSDDLARIEVGDQATIRVDAAPGVKWSAKLNRIDPRGKVIDSEVVFDANIEVANDTNQLRPGMQGTARLSAGTQSIGWLLFYRPTMWAMKKLAW